MSVPEHIAVAGSDDIMAGTSIDAPRPA